MRMATVGGVNISSKNAGAVLEATAGFPAELTARMLLRDGFGVQYALPDYQDLVERELIRPSIRGATQRDATATGDSPDTTSDTRRSPTRLPFSANTA